MTPAMQALLKEQPWFSNKPGRMVQLCKARTRYLKVRVPPKKYDVEEAFTKRADKRRPPHNPDAGPDRFNPNHPKYMGDPNKKAK